MTIKTKYDPPPIPTRNRDWSAWIEGWEEDGPYGYGRTEDEAKADLQEWLDMEEDKIDRQKWLDNAKTDFLEWLDV